MDFINGKEKTIASDLENLERYKLKISSRIRKNNWCRKMLLKRRAEPEADAHGVEVVTSSSLLCLSYVLYELSTRITVWNIHQF